MLTALGGKCGSTYIDRQFVKWMERKFGSKYTSLPWSARGPASNFMKAFESYKRDFGVSLGSSQWYDLPLVMNGVSDPQYYDEDTSDVKLYEYVWPASVHRRR
jgi:hypothetical protein